MGDLGGGGVSGRTGGGDCCAGGSVGVEEGRVEDETGE